MEEKDLEKLTATKLREIAKQYEGITGVHAMKKEELIRAIREARGEPQKEVKRGGETIHTLKKQIKMLKAEKKAVQAKKDKKAIIALRKKIKRFRRLTRKLAKAKIQ
ncbi:MAG: Rho termination factor N-terminal domain-containing protein [Desulfobacterota bacterium]|nr:Rho termination factor N-terminal domain-containing protein [Thermodesulfobacteriota bacterium]